VRTPPPSSSCFGASGRNGADALSFLRSGPHHLRGIRGGLRREVHQITSECVRVGGVGSHLTRASGSAVSPPTINLGRRRTARRSGAASRRPSTPSSPTSTWAGASTRQACASPPCLSTPP
jgi:hypothetical protein